MTDDEYRVSRAVRLFKEAYRCRKEACEIFEELGIVVCDADYGYYNGQIEHQIQIYAGIKELEGEELKVSDRPATFPCISDDKYVGWIKIDGVNFVQLKQPGAYGYELK